MNYDFMYPEGKTKALTFSYDDGRECDRRLVKLFNQYALKGTFHINSGNLDKTGFITSKEIKTLYLGHEIACHGVEHKYLTHLPKELLINELWEDRKNLETLLDDFVLGMSYAFGEYDDRVVNVLKTIGIKYARTVEATNNFSVPSDFLRWRPTCHHNDNILKKAEEFFNIPDFIKLPLFYIWGHSFEFDREETWEDIEGFCELISNHNDIWYTTNIEYRDYVVAIRSLIFSIDQSKISNPSAIPIWIKIVDGIVVVKPGETIKI